MEAERIPQGVHVRGKLRFVVCITEKRLDRPMESLRLDPLPRFSGWRIAFARVVDTRLNLRSPPLPADGGPEASIDSEASMKDPDANAFKKPALVWADEFDGAAGTPPDPEVWRTEVGGHGWGNEELQFYTAGTKNACLDGHGNLAIVARRSNPRWRHRLYGGRRYTSARLISKSLLKTRYGRIEARIKLPAGDGIWPAFWMLGEDIDAVGWPNCGEIDVMENFGTDPWTVHATVHGPGYAGMAGITHRHSAKQPLSDDFHLYRVDWEPERLRWYFDNTPYATTTPRDLGRNPWVFDHEFYFLLNVAVGGVWFSGSDLKVNFPQTMLVDYIRVYEPR